MSCETRPGPAMLGAAAFTSAGIKLSRGGILSRIDQWRIGQLIWPRRIRPSRECRLNNIFETCNLPAIRFELMIGSAHQAPWGMDRKSVHPTRVGRCAVKTSKQAHGRNRSQLFPNERQRPSSPAGCRRTESRRAPPRRLSPTIGDLSRGTWRGHGSIRVQRAPLLQADLTRQAEFMEHG